MVRWGRCLARVVPVVALVSASICLGVSPASAAPATITTVAGGPGLGPALGVGQDPEALALGGSRLWVIDGRFEPTAVRTLDVTTGQESQPIFGFTSSCCVQGEPTKPSAATDPSGDLILAYNSLNEGWLVVRLQPSGVATVIGGGGSLDHVDGVSATQEALNVLNGIAVDANGDIYLCENVYSFGRFTVTVADSRIRKIAPNGTITTVAGIGMPGYSHASTVARSRSSRDPGRSARCRAAEPPGAFVPA